jgi:hypothetical protein
MNKDELFPPLPLDEWEATYDTLHLYFQIVGKVKLALNPPRNHWWHIPLYISSRGITSRAIPYGDGNFSIDFDFIEDALKITTSRGQSRETKLEALSVADFYRAVSSHLSELDIDLHIKAVPYDTPDISTQPFEEDVTHASYDGEYVRRFWSILVQVNGIFQEFQGCFLGKCTPVHLFWHHMDLALTLFSGKMAPERPDAGIVERDAYSHEVISFGFWAGDKNVREPAFYAYAYPPPEGLMDEPLKPAKAFWNRDAGMALLMYNAIREDESPRDALLAFLESVYQAASQKGSWDMDALRYIPPTVKI